MTMYILDTDTCIYWLKGREGIREKVLQIVPDNLRITMVTLAELKYGAYNSQKVPENLQNIENFLKTVSVLPFDQESADRFGKIRVHLRRSGQVIDDFDILIAAATLIHGGVLVTSNTEHFKRIPGLVLENWLVNE